MKAGIIALGHVLTAAQTRRQVEILSRSFDFIHHDDLIARLRQSGTRRPFCLLTFDDGKRSVYSQIAPELERLGVPAVFYVTTRFLSDGAPLWFDKYEALIKALPSVPVGLELETLKELPLQMLEERVDRACDRHKIACDMQSDLVRPMTWPEARALAQKGFSIGAHSLRHAILTRQSEAEALHDIEQSVAEVSAEIGEPCRSFAFPNGNYTLRLARHAIQCGVQTVMTTVPLWVDEHCEPWLLPRVELFGEHSRLEIALKLTAARVQLLANPDGSGRVYRAIAAIPPRLDEEPAPIEPKRQTVRLRSS